MPALMFMAAAFTWWSNLSPKETEICGSSRRSECSPATEFPSLLADSNSYGHFLFLHNLYACKPAGKFPEMNLVCQGLHCNYHTSAECFAFTKSPWSERKNKRVLNQPEYFSSLADGDVLCTSNRIMEKGTSCRAHPTCLEGKQRDKEGKMLRYDLHPELYIKRYNLGQQDGRLHCTEESWECV